MSLERIFTKNVKIDTLVKSHKYRRETMLEKVQTALNKIRPMLQRDGGDVELVGIEGKIVKVKLQGACAGCPMSQMTLKMGIEKRIKEALPSIKEVVAV